MSAVLVAASLAAACGGGGGGVSTGSGGAMGGPSAVAPSTFSYVTAEKAQQLAASGAGVYIRTRGTGWYGGTFERLKGAVPITNADGNVPYSCPMAASSADTGTRSAEICDPYGNVIATISGKDADRGKLAPAAKGREVLTAWRQALANRLKQDQADVAKSRNLGRAITDLEALAKLAGWPEATSAKTALEAALAAGREQVLAAAAAGERERLRSLARAYAGCDVAQQATAALQ